MNSAQNCPTVFIQISPCGNHILRCETSPFDGGEPYHSRRFLNDDAGEDANRIRKEITRNRRRARIPRGLPDQATILRYIRYEPDTGKLFWLERDNAHARSVFETYANVHFNRACAGREIKSSVGNGGYLRVRFLNRTYQAHRLIWCLFHGEWPSLEVDHINRVPSDNRIENLRLATSEENSRNNSLSKRNSTGATGVYRTKSNRWLASIYIGGSSRRLGIFDTFEEAKEARIKANRTFGFRDGHGTPRPEMQKAGDAV